MCPLPAAVLQSGLCGPAKALQHINIAPAQGRFCYTLLQMVTRGPGDQGYKYVSNRRCIKP